MTTKVAWNNFYGNQYVQYLKRLFVGLCISAIIIISPITIWRLVFDYQPPGIIFGMLQTLGFMAGVYYVSEPENTGIGPVNMKRRKELFLMIAALYVFAITSPIGLDIYVHPAIMMMVISLLSAWGR